MKTLILLIAILTSTAGTEGADKQAHDLDLGQAGKTLFQDDFSKQKHAGRRPTRGRWKFGNSSASCVQDDELYKKHKNHGPVMWFDLKFTDAAIEYDVKTEGCRNFVFTVNGKDGHIHRFVTSAKQTSVRAWPKDNDHKSIASVTGKTSVAKLEEWTSVTVELKGGRSVIRIGENEKLTANHGNYAEAKNLIGLGFTFGKANFRNFRVRELK
jgi:hypothetical protein